MGHLSAVSGLWVVNQTSIQEGMEGTEMSKHTPGPWKVGRAEAVRGDWSCHDEDAKTSTAQPITDAAGNVLAFVADSTQSCKERASFDADARLIAAAPELLEALQRVCSHGNRTSQQIGADWDFARAAIAKATGAV